MVKPEQAAAYGEMYRRDMDEEGLRGFAFGHFAEGRLHVNLLPENREELRRGRLKRDLFRRHLAPERLIQIRAILRALDPAGILGGLELTGK